MEYTIRIKRNKQSGWFTGQCEQLPEAITQGRDMKELMFMMQDAIRFALECRRDEFREQYADESSYVRKLRIVNEKEPVIKTFKRKREFSV